MGQLPKFNTEDEDNNIYNTIMYLQLWFHPIAKLKIKLFLTEIRLSKGWIKFW